MNMPHALPISLVGMTGSITLLAAGDAVVPGPLPINFSDLTALAILGSLCLWIVGRIIPSMIKSRDDTQFQIIDTNAKTIVDLSTNQTKRIEEVIAAQSATVTLLCTRQKEDVAEISSAIRVLAAAISAMQSHCAETSIGLARRDITHA